MIDTYLGTVHSGGISGKMSSNALESSQAEQSGGSKGRLRLLHCDGEMSRGSDCKWVNGLEVTVIPSRETATLYIEDVGGQYPPIPGETLLGDARTNSCFPRPIEQSVDLQLLREICAANLKHVH